MLKDIICARPLEGHRLWLLFEDGLEGEVLVSSLVAFSGIFEPLQDPARFAEVQVNPDLGTVCWPNGADLDPLVLYRLLRRSEEKTSAPV
ncbi:MAG: DUF2442 domain-containing protein [Elstera sp.]